MADAAPRDSLTAGDYLRVLRHRWPVLLVCALLGAAAAGALHRLQPVEYRTSATVLVRPVHVDPSRSLIRPDHLVSMPTEREVLRSASVVQGALDAAGIRADAAAVQRRLSVAVLEGTQVLSVTYVDADPVRAQRIVQALTRQYLEQRRESAAGQVERRTNDIRERLEATRSALEEVDETIAGSAPRSAEHLQALSHRDYLINQIQPLQVELASVSGLSVEPGQIISDATRPEEPTGSGPGLAILIGLGSGVLVGLPAAFVIDRQQDRVRDEADVEASIGLPVLASVPRWRPRRRVAPTVLARSDPVLDESFRRLRANVQSLASRSGWTSIMVTSASPREGKSEVAANLAVSAARAGTPVVLVSADVRLPTLHALFGLPLAPGLCDVVERGRRLASVAWTIPQLPCLRVLTAGEPTGEPGDLFGAPALGELIAAATEEGGLVVVDAPPVLAVSECLALAGHTDAVLLVARGDRTRCRDLRAARRSLDRIPVAIAGAVLVCAGRRARRTSAYLADRRDAPRPAQRRIPRPHRSPAA